MTRPLSIPDIASDVKSFFCACADMDLHDPIVLQVLAERNLRLLAERGADVKLGPKGWLPLVVRVAGTGERVS